MFDRIQDFLFGKNFILHIRFFSLIIIDRTRPSSAGSKKPPTFCPTSNGVRESIVRPNAWTVTTNQAGRSVISGSFSGELDLPNADNTEITNRVDQLEKEIKGRDTEIRDLNDRVNRKKIDSIKY